MKIELRYFASLREALGSGETVEAAPGSTVGALRDWLIASDAAHAAALGRGRLVRSALDRAVCDDATPLHEGAELAFFPPVTGG